MSKRDFQSHPARHRQHGLTLVEMMVAVTIAALLLAGTVQIFISSKRTYRAQEALSRLQENGRYAMQLLTTNIRQAGDTGCYKGSLGSVESILDTTDATTNYGWDASTMLVGYDTSNTSSTWTPTLDTALSNITSYGPVTGSDVITIRYMASDGLDLVPPYNTSDQLFVDTTQFNADPLNNGDVVLVTDCSHASIAQITSHSSSGATKTDLAHSSSNCSSGMCPGNKSPAQFANQFGAGSQIARFETYSYYVATDPDGIPALYRASPITTGATAYGNATEMVQGVRDMQIEYGYRGTDASNNYYYYYVPASSTLDMSKVVAVRITLTVESINDHVADSSETYTYGGTSITDYRLHDTFETTITLRNRTS